MRPIAWRRSRTGLVTPIYSLPPVTGGSDWPALGEGGQFESGVDASLSAGFLLTSGGAAHTKGAYTQLLASSAFDAEGFWVHLGRGVIVTSYLVDIAVGGAGAEVDLVKNLVFYNPSNDSGQRRVYVPIGIPAGSRISSRCQSAGGASQTMRAGITLQAHGFIPSSPLGRWTEYGISTATSTASATVDPGGTIHTKGVWSQIVASTTFDIENLIVALGWRQQTAAAGIQWLVDIGVGPATETILISNWWEAVNGPLDEFLNPYIGPIPVHIPEGTRLSVRAQCATATSPDRIFACGMYGID